ncbi:MAG: hypothetical protein ACP5VS_08185 [Desulfomonilaceae bacterium]
MRRHFIYSLTLALLGVMAILGTEASHSQDYLSESCSQLIKKVQTLQDDLKTVDTILNTATQAGDTETVQKYTVKKASIKKKLKSASTAVDAKSCLNSE